MVIGSYISTITLNVSGVNAPTKGIDWQSTCMYAFHLPHHSAHSPECMQLLYVVRLVMFPLWLAIVIIFYFLSGY